MFLILPKCNNQRWKLLHSCTGQAPSRTPKIHNTGGVLKNAQDWSNSAPIDINRILPSGAEDKPILNAFDYVLCISILIKCRYLHCGHHSDIIEKELKYHKKNKGNSKIINDVRGLKWKGSIFNRYHRKGLDQKKPDKMRQPITVLLCSGMKAKVLLIINYQFFIWQWGSSKTDQQKKKLQLPLRIKPCWRYSSIW